LHWSVAIVINPGAILEHRALLLDEVDISAGKLREWLNSEWKRLRPESGIEAPFDAKTMKIYSPKGSSLVFPMPFSVMTLTISAVGVVAIRSTLPRQQVSRAVIVILSEGAMLKLQSCIRSWDCGVYVCRYVFAIYKLRKKVFSYGEVGYSRPEKPARLFRDLITESDEFDFDAADISRIRLNFRELLERLSVLYDRWKEADTLQRKAIKNQRKKAKVAMGLGDPECVNVNLKDSSNANMGDNCQQETGGVESGKIESIGAVTHDEDKMFSENYLFDGTAPSVERPILGTKSPASEVQDLQTNSRLSLLQPPVEADNVEYLSDFEA
jgi:hypothetical protein